MNITIKGGETVLIVGKGAVAHVKDSRGTKLTGVAALNSTLIVDGQPISAYFTDGAAGDQPLLWLVDELRFLGFVVHPKKQQKPRKLSPARKTRSKRT